MIVAFVAVFIFILKIFNQMFNPGDVAMGDIKAVFRKIAMTVEQQVDATIEEIQAVPDRVAESVQRASKNSVKDVKDALIEVVMAIEEGAGVAWKRLEETMLLPEAPVAVAVAAAAKARAGVEIVVPPRQTKNWSYRRSHFPSSRRHPWRRPLTTERHTKDVC